MPRVPVRDAPTVRDAAQPTPYFQPGDVRGAFGVGLGGAVSDAAGVAGHVYAKERARATVSRLRDLSAQADTWENEQLQAALARKGRDALQVTDQTLAEWGKVAGQIEMQLPLDAREDWRMEAQQRGQRMHRVLQGHELAEGERLDRETLEAKINAAVSNVGLIYNDPAVVGSYLRDAEADLLSYADDYGWSPEMQEEQARGLRTRVHSAVVNGYLEDGQAVQAGAYLAANADQMDGATVNELRRKLKPQADIQRTSLAADDIWKRAGQDYGKALELVRPDDPLRVPIENELGRRRDRANEVRADREREAWDDFYPAWVAAGRSIASSPPELRARLSPKQVESIVDQEAQDDARARTYASMGAAERRAAEQERRTDSALKLGDLMVLAEDDPAALLATMADPKVLAGLTPSDVTRAKAIQARTIKGLRSAEGKALTPAAERVLIEEARSAGLLAKGTTGQGEADREKRRTNARWVGLLEAFDSWQDGYIAQHKRLPGADEARTAIRGMLIRSVHDSPWYDPFNFDKTFYGFEEGFDPGEVEIPADERTAIEDSLRRHGRAITEDAIRNLYLAGVGR